MSCIYIIQEEMANVLATLARRALPSMGISHSPKKERKKKRKENELIHLKEENNVVTPGLQAGK